MDLAFQENGDGGRTAISGFNGGNPSRTVASFPAGFGADYAISIEKGFIGVFQLASGGDNSLGFLFGQAQSGNNSDASYGITMTPAQMAMIGLTANNGQTFGFVGSLLSTSAYRSNETIGQSTTIPEHGSGNAGFNHYQTFTQGLSYPWRCRNPRRFRCLVSPPSRPASGLGGANNLLRTLHQFLSKAPRERGFIFAHVWP